MTTDAMKAQRDHYLDNLKVFLTILVIFHHAGQAYGDGGAWAYTPSNPAETMPWIWHFFSTNAAFFMGLYFFISGYFVPLSYDRQGFRQFVGRKLLRLGVPLVAMGCLLSLMCGKFEIAHMWFVESLLLFCILYALWRLVAGRASAGSPQEPSLAMMVAVAAVMGCGSYMIRTVSQQDHWIGLCGLVLEPAHYLQYVMMFVMGIVASRKEWLTRMGDRTGAAAMTVGVALAVGNYMRDGGPWDAFVWRWFGIYESFMCVSISFGLLWLFRQKANMTNSVCRWMAGQSYGAYILHLPLMIVFQNMVDGIWIGAFGKFMLVGTVVTAISYAMTWLLRMIPGANRIL